MVVHYLLLSRSYLSISLYLLSLYLSLSVSIYNMIVECINFVSTLLWMFDIIKFKTTSLFCVL